MKEPTSRKEESLSILRELGVPVLESLPLIEPANETILRKASDVARRSLCLMIVSELARGADLETAQQFLKQNQLNEFLTPEESNFLKEGHLDRQRCISMSWRCEGAYLLLWALGKIETLPIPSSQNDLNEIYAVIPSLEDVAIQWIQEVQLRDIEAILDESDLIYRMHWATRQSNLQGKALEELDSGVVQEWHHAINWLTSYENLDWDDVTTDT
jgi:hypothetical protein